MKKLSTLALALLLSSQAFASGQVFYRYGISKLSEDRGGQIFTDTGAAAGKNDDDQGTSLSAGLDLKLMDCPLSNNSLLGEIYVDYNKFSDKRVANAIGQVAGVEPKVNEVTVSQLAVVIAPKYRFELGKFRPWIIPAGLAFLVNSPPSNTTNYLDVGYHAGVGAEYMVLKELSLGADVRYTAGAGDPQLKVKYTSYGAYLGINF